MHNSNKQIYGLARIFEGANRGYLSRLNFLNLQKPGSWRWYVLTSDVGGTATTGGIIHTILRCHRYGYTTAGTKRTVCTSLRVCHAFSDSVCTTATKDLHAAYAAPTAAAYNQPHHHMHPRWQISRSGQERSVPGQSSKFATSDANGGVQEFFQICSRACRCC